MISKAEVVQLYLDTPIGTTRVPVNRDDWGDPGTIRLCVKRVGATICSPEDHFGIYLGRHHGRYVIALNGMTGGETFATIEEMKQRWELD